MFSKFKLNNIEYSDFQEYEEIGKEYYKEIQIDIHDKFKDFIGKEGIINGTELQESRFPTKQNFNVFLSHSHDDQNLAISLAGFFKKELNLDTFIDSCMWGYSNELLREIDNNYCRCSDGKYYDYDKRNYSTSHVHMMLSIALAKMINQCETVFFLNSDNSITSIADEISCKKTTSPWIYNELALANLIQVQSINRYRDKFLKFASSSYDKPNESSSLKIEYDVDKLLKGFTSISKIDLDECVKEWKKNKYSFQSALDYIYLSKNIIKQTK